MYRRSFVFKKSYSGLGLDEVFKYGQRNGILLIPVTRAPRFIITVDREDVHRMGGTNYPTFYRYYANRGKRKYFGFDANRNQSFFSIDAIQGPEFLQH